MTHVKAERRIFHLAAARDWGIHADGDGPVATDQLERHGFVHCCTREQIVEVATWWLAGDAPLVAIEIDADRAGDVRFERADLGRQYPHVYNAIPRDAVTAVHEVAPGPDGSLVLPPSLATPPPGFTVEGTLDGRGVAVRWQGGAFVGGDSEALARIQEAVAKAAPVPQFPGVERTACADTAYDAFCVAAAVFDTISAYAGDGFEEAAG